MANNPSILTKKKAAIITNNLHCERHVQYFSTVEKYFKANGWMVADDFMVNKIVICGCGFHDAMYEKIAKTLVEIRRTNFLEKNIIILACLTKTHAQDLKESFNGQIIPFHREELLDQIIDADIPFNEIRPVNIFKVHEKCSKDEQENEKFYIKISQGCLRECTFCIINKAKGYITSVSPEKIGQQVQRAVECGKNKVFLMGEDTFAYGIDIGTDIIRLVEYLVEIAPTVDFYFGYLHIRWLQKYAKDIISLCKRGIFKELHIGLQHVNQEILKRMGRPVKVSEIYDIIRTIKRECPDLYMVADIIVGFPGETEEAFNELVEFFKKDKCFNKVKHFGYSDVKGAPSANFKNKVSNDVIALRWDILDKILGPRSYSNEDRESRTDNETFRITRFEDYSFCKDTFDEMMEKNVAPRSLSFSKSGRLKHIEGDFEF